MEEIIKKYCDEICSRCMLRKECKPLENIIYVEDNIEGKTAICENYNSKKQLRTLCKALKNIDK